MADLPVLILASASPRRRELLSTLAVPFQVQVAGIDERLPSGVSLTDAVLLLAAKKASAVGDRRPGGLVLAADTLVSVDGALLGKPPGPDDARVMLRRLRGRDHTVATGVCLSRKAKHWQRLVVTNVTARNYTDAEIEASIAAGTPFDKAGAYGIQDPFLRPVFRTEGCWCNVMGLPLWSVVSLLREACSVIRPERPDRTRRVCATCPLALNKTDLDLD